MNRLLLLPFSLIFNFIRINVGKCIVFGVLAFGIYGVITSTHYEMVEKTIMGRVKHGNDYLYIIKTDHDPTVLTFTKPQKVTNNIILSKEETGKYTGYLVLTIIMSIVGMILLIASVIESDCSWDIKEVFQKTISVLIKCEFEEGKYCYTILGRLISIQQDKQYTGSDCLAYRFDINNVASVLNLPKYKTKTSKRNSYLDKLGIE